MKIGFIGTGKLGMPCAAAIDSAVKFFNRSDADIYNDMNKINSILTHNISMMAHRSHLMEPLLKDSLRKYLYE